MPGWLLYQPEEEYRNANQAGNYGHCDRQLKPKRRACVNPGNECDANSLMKKTIIGGRRRASRLTTNS